MKARIGAQYAIACVIIFSPLFVFAAPPKLVDDVQKVPKGAEFNMPEKPTPSTNPQGPKKPDPDETLKRLREQDQKNLPTDGKLKGMEKGMKALEEDMARSEQRIRKLNNEELIKAVRDKKSEKIISQIQNDIARYYDSKLKDRTIRGYLDHQRRMIAQAKKELQSTKGKTGLMIIPCVVAGVIGFDFSEDAVAGSITKCLIDIDKKLDTLNAQLAHIIDLEAEFENINKKIEENRKALEEIEKEYEKETGKPFTEEVFNNNDLALALQKNMIDLGKEALRILPMIQLRPLIEGQIQDLQRYKESPGIKK